MIKLGVNLENDKRKLGLIRNLKGDDCLMMVDSNQRWYVEEAITWMKELALYKLLCIEEPTSPDDVAGELLKYEFLFQILVSTSSLEKTIILSL